MTGSLAPDGRVRRDAWTLHYAALLALMFIGYPVLSSGLGALDAYARVFSVVYRAFVVFSSFGLIAYATARASAESWRGAVPVAFCALWAMLLARFLWDASFVPLPLPLPWFDYFLMMVGAVLVPTVALFQAPSERAFDIARRIILCGGVLSGMFILSAVIRIVIEEQNIDALRRLGTDELNPISLGYVGVALVIVSVLSRPPPPATALVARVLDSRFVRVTAGLLGGLLVIASASKGPIVALLGAVTVAQLTRIARTRSGIELAAAIMRLTAIIIAMAVTAFVLAVLFNVRVLDRFVDFAVDTSTSDRLGMFTRALLQFESSPWFGSAFVETQSRFYPHNLFVETLMAIGIPGLCLVLVILGGAVLAGVRVLGSRHDWVALLAVQYLLGVMFSGSIYFTAEFWIAMSAVCAIDKLLARSEQPRPQASELALGARAH